MTTVMITQTGQIIKSDEATPVILIIRTYDNKKGEWMIEASFAGGAKVTGVATTDFVNSLESDLADQGWQISPSLFNGGFNAKPGPVDELMFASSAGLWPDDYGLSEATI